MNSPVEQGRGAKRSLEADIEANNDAKDDKGAVSSSALSSPTPALSSPPTKKQRATEYVIYMVIGEDHDMTFVYFLDASSAGADEAVALLAKCMEYDVGKYTSRTADMLNALASNDRKVYYDKWVFFKELQGLKDLGQWECFDFCAPEVQGRRGVVYFVYGFE